MDYKKIVENVGKEYAVATEIYRITKIGGKIATFSKLKENFKGVLTPAQIDDCLDSLDDIGFLENGYKQDGTRWVHGHEISEIAENRIGELYKILYQEN